MKNKILIIFVTIIGVLTLGNTVFIFKQHLSESRNNAINIINEEFDSLYNVKKSFLESNSFVKNSMLYKIEIAEKIFSEADLKTEKDLLFIKSTIDTLNKSIQEDERILNMTLRKNNIDTMIFFKSNWMNIVSAVKLSEGKEPFFIILDSLKNDIQDRIEAVGIMEELRSTP